MSGHTRAPAWRGSRLASGIFLITLHLISLSGAYHWTWSSSIHIAWLASRPQGCCCLSPGTEFIGTNCCRWLFIYVDAGDPNLGPHSYAARINHSLRMNPLSNSIQRWWWCFNSKLVRKCQVNLGWKMADLYKKNPVVCCVLYLVGIS